MKYEVIVGNIGCVYSGSSYPAALRDYREYVTQSTSGPYEGYGYGRASGEDVTLMEDGSPIHEHLGSKLKEAV